MINSPKEWAAFAALSTVLFAAAVGGGALADDLTHRNDAPEPQEPVQPPATPKPAATPPPKVVTKVVTKTVTKEVKVRVSVPGPTVFKDREVIKFVDRGNLLPRCPDPSGAGVNICWTPGPAGSKGSVKVNSGTQTIVMW